MPGLVVFGITGAWGSPWCVHCGSTGVAGHPCACAARWPPSRVPAGRDAALEGDPTGVLITATRVPVSRRRRWPSTSAWPWRLRPMPAPARSRAYPSGRHHRLDRRPGPARADGEGCSRAHWPRYQCRGERRGQIGVHGGLGAGPSMMWKFRGAPPDETRRPVGYRTGSG